MSLIVTDPDLGISCTAVVSETEIPDSGFREEQLEESRITKRT